MVNTNAASHRRPYVVVTKWSYPYGGGEQFMRQTMFMCAPMHAVWIAFYNARNEPFGETQISTLKHLNEANGDGSHASSDRNFEKNGGRKNNRNNGRLCWCINVSGGFTERKLYCWLRLLQPALVHHQGALRTEVERAAHTLGVPVMAGFHFWHGLVQLREPFMNVRIEAHAHEHCVDPQYAHTERRSDVVYVASEFMRAAVAATCGRATASRLRVIAPMPDAAEVAMPQYGGPPLPAIDVLSEALSPANDKATNDPSATTNNSCSKFTKDSPGPLADKTRELALPTNRFVTVVNIHETKGGRLFLHLAKRLRADIPLLGVRTDVFRTPTDVEIDEAVAQRNGAHVVGRVDDVRLVYARTALLLQPSECDETFCRVLVEAHMNGIPTLASDYGNVPHLHVTEAARQQCIVWSEGQHDDGSHAYYERWRLRIEEEWQKITALGFGERSVPALEDLPSLEAPSLELERPTCSSVPSSYSASLSLPSSLSSSSSSSSSMSAVVRENYEVMLRKLNARGEFLAAVHETLARAAERRRNVALLAPWCDQGLGVQTRSYAVLLRNAGFRVSVFAFRPYTGAREQADESEWRLDGVDVYYSPHHREEVLRNELLAFAVRRRVAVAVIAETCWHRVFSMMAELRAVGVRTVAVPNWEIVRLDEIEKHRVFDRILLNNRACEALFRARGYPPERLRYVSYASTPRENVRCRDVQPNGEKNERGARVHVPNAELEPTNERESSEDRHKTPEYDADGRRVLRLLVLGGRNAVFRKQVDVIVDAFLRYALDAPDAPPMKLVATSQLECAELAALAERVSASGGRATIIYGNLPVRTVEDLYRSTDVVLQCSKLEGLGLGFMEAQRFDCPIVTLNVAPHNECAPSAVAWHLEPHAMLANAENNSCAVQSARVVPETFRDFFAQTAERLRNDNARWWRDEYEPRRAAIFKFDEERRSFYTKSFLQSIEELCAAPNRRY